MELKKKSHKITEWRQTTLGSLGGFRNGVNFNRHQEGSGIPVLKVKDFGSRFFAPKSDYDELDSNLIDIPESQFLQEGDIVIIRSNGNGQLVGRSMYFSGIKKPITFSGFCIRFRPNPKVIHPRFTAYLIRSPFFRQRFTAYGSGTGIQNLSQEILSSVPVTLPSIEEQRSISNILSSLDDKIELNENTNKILNSICRLIFKHWFVDFEFPNEEGKPYKSSGGEFVYNEELRKKIPSGWKVSNIGDKFDLVLGGTPSTAKKSYWENGTIAWINSGKINEFRIIEPTTFITEEAVTNSATKLLPKGTTVLAITGATLGQVSRIEIDTCANQSVIGIIESETIHSEYIYFWIKHTINEIMRRQTGGAQQHINKNDVSNSKILIPSLEVIQEYQKIINPIFDKISLLCFENKDLVHIRDSLLPKLMSGKIRVPVEA